MTKYVTKKDVYAAIVESLKATDPRHSPAWDNTSVLWSAYRLQWQCDCERIARSLKDIDPGFDTTRLIPKENKQ